MSPAAALVTRLVLALLVGAGGAAVAGCTSDPTDADGDLAGALTADNATALVADGASPTGEAVEGMPDDAPGRIGWLLTEVDWDEQEADELGDGLSQAVADEPALLAATLRGVAESPDRVHPELRDTVGALLATRTDDVVAALAGPAPPADAALDRDDLLATAASLGPEPLAPLREDLTERMEDGMLADLPIPVPDGPPAVRAWDRAYPEVYEQHVRPVVLLLAASVREACAGGDDDECRAVIAGEGDVADRVYTGVVNSRIPLTLLPGRLADVLVTEPDGTRTGLTDDDLEDLWADFRRREGYDLVELTLAEVWTR